MTPSFVLEHLGHLRRVGAVPRIHPNGFIQLDTNERSRMHFWCHPRIPRQASPTPIHDHSFGFDSTVLLGTILNVRYEEAATPTHQVYQAVCADGEESQLIPTSRVTGLVPTQATIIEPGDGYYMEPWAIHQTIVDRPSVSIISKSDQGGARPNVFVPIGRHPDNSFRRDILSQATLWTIIDEIVHAC